ncbi:diguanylate cyclase, partial [Clostridioides difficile]|nr:diguanylate cyclase [Clostridioides difficile]
MLKRVRCSYLKKNRLIIKNISIAFIVLFFFSVFTFFYIGNISRVLEYETNDIMTVTITGWIILSFLFLCIIIYILYSKAKSQKTIEKVAYTDFVTGYSNWRKFELDVTNLLKKTSQNNKYAMVIFDIDKFKAINDIYGHKKGNLILKDIADTLNELTNINETFARVSADNFNILLTYNKKEDIINIIKKIIANNELVNLSFGIYEI